MDQKWHFTDIIDLEFFLHRDETGETSTAPPHSVSLNRKIYLDFARTHAAPFKRRGLLKYWVDQLRDIENQGIDWAAGTPGEIFHESYRIVYAILILVALISGATTAWTLLSYRAENPINVFTFLWVLIVPQSFLLVIRILTLLMNRLGLLKNVRGAYRLTSSLIHGIAFKIKRAGENSLSAARRNLIQDAMGVMIRQKRLYGPILFWPVFSLFQAFGVCFNAGALCAALTKVTITDLAFGWQSTLMVKPQALYRFIEYIALPWSWIVPMPYAHPSMGQIEGSKIVLKDGMAHLATADLVSWWPFLCLIILVYGLIPRLILLFYGIWKHHREMGRLDFTHAACDRLIQKMETPQVSTLSRLFTQQTAPSDMIFKPEPEYQEPLADSGESMPAAIIFIPEDIDAMFAEDDLADRILSVFRLRILGRVRYAMDYAKEKTALKNLMEQTDVSLSAARLIILQEAWQAPIRETISWIRDIRNAVGKKTGIIIALIGKPSHKIKFTPPRNSDLIIWEHAINAMGDPYIRIENLGG
ncbi:MAG: DUF2868 domain-containing protein [Desulfobacterales bacterium]|nr:DUF2868 domain-containing protein [Desulfobacterales bacterium]